MQVRMYVCTFRMAKTCVACVCSSKHIVFIKKHVNFNGKAFSC